MSPPHLDKNVHRGPGEPDNSTQSLSHDASWVFLGNVVFAASQWILLVVLAKLGTVEEVGLFALANAISAPVFMLSDLNLRAYLATDAGEEFPFATYLGCRAFSSGLALISIFVVGLVTSQSRESFVVLMAVSGAKAFESLSTVAFGLYQKQNRMRWLAGSLTLKSFLSVASFTSVLLMTKRLDLSVLALAGSRLITFVAYDLPHTRRLASLSLFWSAPGVTKLARSALPLGVIMMLTSLNSNLGLYFIESLLGTVAVGHFAAILYLITAARIVVNALSQTASPRLARLLHARDRSGFDKLQRMLIGLGLAIGVTGAIGAWLLGETVLSLVYSPEYAEYSVLLVWLIAANSFTFANAFLAAGLTAMRSFGPMLAINVFSIILTTTLLAVLIPKFGLIGAAWAAGASAASKFALNYHLSRRSQIWSTTA